MILLLTYFPFLRKKIDFSSAWPITRNYICILRVYY